MDLYVLSLVCVSFFSPGAPVSSDCFKTCGSGEVEMALPVGVNVFVCQRASNSAVYLLFNVQRQCMEAIARLRFKRKDCCHGK